MAAWRGGVGSPVLQLLARLGAGHHQSSYRSKSALRAPQTGAEPVAGMSSNAVADGMPPSGSPSAGS